MSQALPSTAIDGYSAGYDEHIQNSKKHKDTEETFDAVLTSAAICFCRLKSTNTLSSMFLKFDVIAVD